MSETEYKELHNQFVKGITWKMIAVAIGGLVSATFFVRGKVDDLMNYQVETRQISETYYNKLDRKIDVKFDTLDRRIERLRERVDNTPEPAPRKAVRQHPTTNYGLYTQRVINGQLTFIPYK